MRLFRPRAVPALSLVLAAPVQAGDGFVPYLGGLLCRGGATPRGYPKAHDPLGDSLHPPVGVVLGAGVVGAIAGHLVFDSLLVSAGLGIGAMSVAASAEGQAGDIARSSGRMVLSAFERTVEMNRRYELTTKAMEGVKSAARGLRRFDEEHELVHKATEGARGAWRGLREFDDTHQLSTKAGSALSAGLDKLAHVLEPPSGASPTSDPGISSGAGGSPDGYGGSWSTRESVLHEAPHSRRTVSGYRAERARGERRQQTAAAGVPSSKSWRSDNDEDWWDQDSDSPWSR